MLKHLAALAALASVACAGAASEKDAATALIHYDIGVTSLNSGDLRGALRELLGAVELDPDLAEAHHGLGLVFHSMGRNNDALTHYEKAVALRPAFSEAHNNFGVLLLDMGRYDEAIAHFKIALGDILYATPSLAEGNLGWAYYRKGDTEEGLRHLRNALALNPKFCRGYGWLARIEMERGRGEQVVAYCKRYQKHCAEDAQIAPGLPAGFQQEMSYYLAMGLTKLGDRTAARAAFSACAQVQVESDLKVQCERALSDSK